MKAPHLSPEKRALLERRLGGAPQRTVPLAPIPRRPERDVAPLSFIQRQMWVIDQMTPGNPAYNLLAGYRLHGRLDVGALERSFNEIIKRHEALRTTFAATGGEPQQHVHQRLTVSIRVTALDHLDTEQREARLRSLASEEAVTPFDLSRLPLIRVTLFRLGASEHVLLINVHHIVADGLSFSLLLNELDTFYRASRPPELALQYGDFAHWQRQTEAHESEFWRTQLANLSALELPTDRPRPAAQSFAGSDVLFTIPPALAQQLKDLGA